MHAGYAQKKPHLPICACVFGDLEVIKKQIEVSAINDAAGPEKQ